MSLLNLFLFLHKMNMKIDVHFIEFYIFKKHNQKLEEYFDVNKSISSRWRKSHFPDKRLHEFVYREGTSDMIELLKRVYK
jgi:hypothetical protein